MLEVSRQGAVDVVATDQPLTGDEAVRISEAVARCLAGGQPMVVLDLHRVPLVDSRGLELLLDLLEQFQAFGGTLKLAGPNELFRDILRITGIGERFEIYGDVEIAVGSFAR